MTHFDHSDLDRLERDVDALVHLNQRLRDENRALRSQRDTLAAERAELADKHEQARVRIEVMLSRLRTLEESL